MHVRFINKSKYYKEVKDEKQNTGLNTVAQRVEHCNKIILEYVYSIQYVAIYKTPSPTSLLPPSTQSF